MRVIPFFILLIIGFFAGAQPVKDSLDAMNDRAYTLIDQDPEQAERLVDQSIELAVKEGLKSPLINSHTVKGIIYKNKGYYELAASEYLEALKFADELNDKGRQSACLNNIGIIYQQQKNHQKSIQYFLDAIELEEDLDNPLQLSIRYYNLGKSYDELDSLSLAKAYYLNSLLIEETMKSNEGIMYAYIGLGSVAIKNDKLEEGFEYLYDAEKLASTEKINTAIPLINLKLGELMVLKGEYGSAIAYYQSGIVFAQEIGNETHRLELLKHLSQAYEYSENFSEAYRVLNQYLNELEKTNGVEVNSRVEELQFQYEKAKSEQTIEQLKHENELSQLNTVYSDKMLKYLVFIVVVILLLIGYNLYKVVRNKGGDEE